MQAIGDTTTLHIIASCSSLPWIALGSSSSFIVVVFWLSTQVASSCNHSFELDAPFWLQPCCMMTKEIPVHASGSPKDPPPARAARPAAKSQHPGQLAQAALTPPTFTDPMVHRQVAALEQHKCASLEICQTQEARIQLLEQQLAVLIQIQAKTLCMARRQTKILLLARSVHSKVNWLQQEVDQFEQDINQPTAAEHTTPVARGSHPAMQSMMAASFDTTDSEDTDYSRAFSI